MNKAFVACVTILLLLPTLVHAAPPTGTDAPVITRLSGGMRLVCKPEPGTPLVAVDVFVRTDPANEAIPGLSALGTRALLVSTSNLSPGSMTREIGALGGNMSATFTPDWVQVSLLTTPNKLDDALFLLADVLQNADFDADGLDDARQGVLSDIDSGNANTFPVAQNALRRVLFAGTPQAAPPFGTIAGVQKISRADLLRWYGRTFLPSRFLFVAAGAIVPSSFATKLSADLSRFPRRDTGHVSAPAALPTPSADFAALHTPLPGLSEVCVMAGFRLPMPTSADYAPLLVANARLGGMKTSRLFSNLRDKEGLGYEVGSLVTTRLGGGDLTAYVFSAPTRVDPATKKSQSVLGPIKEGMLREIDALQTTPLTPAELARAKHFLIGTDTIRHERLEDRASLLGIAALLHPDSANPESDWADAINAVTAADVQRVAQIYFVHPAVSVVEPNGQGGAATE